MNINGLTNIPATESDNAAGNLHQQQQAILKNDAQNDQNITQTTPQPLPLPCPNNSNWVPPRWRKIEKPPVHFKKIFPKVDRDQPNDSAASISVHTPLPHGSDDAAAPSEQHKCQMNGSLPQHPQDQQDQDPSNGDNASEASQQQQNTQQGNQRPQTPSPALLPPGHLPGLQSRSAPLPNAIDNTTEWRSTMNALISEYLHSRRTSPTHFFQTHDFWLTRPHLTSILTIRRPAHILVAELDDPSHRADAAVMLDIRREMVFRLRTLQTVLVAIPASRSEQYTMLLSDVLMDMCARIAGREWAMEVAESYVTRSSRDAGMRDVLGSAIERAHRWLWEKFRVRTGLRGFVGSGNGSGGAGTLSLRWGPSGFRLGDGIERTWTWSGLQMVTVAPPEGEDTAQAEDEEVEWDDTFTFLEEADDLDDETEPVKSSGSAALGGTPLSGWLTTVSPYGVVGDERLAPDTP